MSLQDAINAVDEISPENIHNLSDVGDVQIVVDYIISELVNLEYFKGYYCSGVVSLTEVLEFYYYNFETVRLRYGVIEDSRKLYGLIDSAEYCYASYLYDGTFEKMTTTLEEIHEELSRFLNDIESERGNED